MKASIRTHILFVELVTARHSKRSLMDKNISTDDIRSWDKGTGQNARSFVLAD